MKKTILAALLLFMSTLNCQLSIVNCQLSTLHASDVVRLEPASGSASEYKVAGLLRVELDGDYIRFIESDGSLAAEVYKYDYVKLTVTKKQPTAVEPASGSVKQPMAQKVIMNGQVYILFGDKAYLISGTNVR